MTTQQELDNAAIDALALTTFMTGEVGATNLNSGGNDVGSLADLRLDVLTSAGMAQIASVAALQADTMTRPVGQGIVAQKQSAVFTVTDDAATAHLITAGGTLLHHNDGPYIIAISGQSNAAGSNSDGPNPASPLVRIWDGVALAWGSSDRTLAPLIQPNPHGNLGANNYALARAHRVADETGRPVFVVYDAQGGQSIDEWVATGVTSPRYAALVAKIAQALGTAFMTVAGKTKVDEMIFAQGEADFEADFATYLAKIKLLRQQLRAEPWCDEDMPIYMMGPSDLHDRYQWRDAMRHLCAQVDSRCIYVPSNGLRTQFSQTGTGDFTHFLGESLWEAGYTRIADAHGSESPPTMFYGRGTGAADATDETALATFRTLISRDSWTTEIPPNGPAATGSISWGYTCVADGNYTFALGYECATDNLANYGIVAGRAVLADANADYFAGFGYQSTISARYTLVSGRGNVVADEGGTAVGTFAEFATPQTDAVLLQVGRGTGTSSRANALTVRKSGRVEVKNLPVYATVAAAIAGGLGVGNLFRTSAGALRVVV